MSWVLHDYWEAIDSTMPVLRWDRVQLFIYRTVSPMIANDLAAELFDPKFDNSALIRLTVEVLQIYI